MGLYYILLQSENIDFYAMHFFQLIWSKIGSYKYTLKDYQQSYNCDFYFRFIFQIIKINDNFL